MNGASEGASTSARQRGVVLEVARHFVLVALRSADYLVGKVLIGFK